MNYALHPAAALERAAHAMNKTPPAALSLAHLLRLLACLTCLLPAAALAQPAPYLPAGLSENELNALDLAGRNDAALTAWRRRRAYDVAKENLRRAALIERCTAIRERKPDDFDFDPVLRAALDGVVDKMRAGKIFPLGLESYRYSMRAVLWAQRHTGAGEWQALWRRAQTPAGRRALQRQRAVQVMDGYGDATDIETGATLAYPPIPLKAYFVRSGQLGEFERALQSAAPALVASFARVRTLQDHGEADFPWLRELAGGLEKNMAAISNAFVDGLPQAESREIDELASSPYFTLYEDAAEAGALFVAPADRRNAAKIDDPKFGGIKFGDRAAPNYREFVRASVESEYPQPPAFMERMMRMGPRDFIDNAHRPFCPQ